MLYRRFPRIPEKEISVLGFGMMRLPLKKDTNEIDYEQTKAMVKNAFDNGINYFDTAYPYHGGKSEVVLGKAVKELGIRDKIYIADKMPLWDVKKQDDLQRIFDEQLKRLGTDYIDFYLLHAMNAERWQQVKDLQILSFIRQLKSSGKIKHIGFSFHDSPDAFKTIIDGFPMWEFCQVQYNYMDRDAADLIAYAAKNEIGSIVMEPLRGGLLAQPPKPVLDIFAAASKPRMPAEWGLRWVWENQNVVVALSGMSAPEQMVMNIATACAGHPNSLPNAQLDTVKKASEWFNSRVKVPCTGCNYCSPCPKKIAISDIFREWNRLSLNGHLEATGNAKSAAYSDILKSGRGVDQCVECRLCEGYCPQKIQIPDLLKVAHSAMQ
ncbi:MAG: aldo/keto reductase [Spirochaetaceae bacterium]|nr:aldo/keto reductase [Spirochaetaceae bacterium]MBP5329615.1 aldo/keto reductase [Spirochaetaceae bacterium]